MAIERALCPVLIGREKELSLLEDALLTSLRGEGRVVVLAGEAGIGKSRLTAELSRRAAKVGCAVLAGSCSEAELAIPYLPFAESIGNHLAGVDAQELRARLGAHARELAQLFPEFGAARVAGDGGDPAHAKLRLFDSVTALLRLFSAGRGLLLVIEDVHWIDASARELLDYLTHRLADSRILLLVTYRREELNRQHPLLPSIQAWRRSGLASVVELEPLPADGIADMVRAIFDEPEVTDEFRDYLHGRSEGNPFVLEEMLKTAIDRRDIFFRPETGLWDRKTIAELQLPPTVRDLILLRLDRLALDDREILRGAAVLGRSFDQSTLTAVTRARPSTVEFALETATREQLIEEDPDVSRRYRFRHALTQEAIYQDLSAPQRKRLHLAAATALRARPGASLSDVAHHLMAAERWAEAEPVCLQAAEEAKRRYGYREAAALYERLIPHLIEPVQQGRVRCILGDAYFVATDTGAAMPALADGIRMLEEHGNWREAAHYRLVLARCYWDQSRSDMARTEVEHALSVLEPLGPSEDLAFGYVSMGRLLVLNYEHREALPHLERGIAVADAAGAPAPRIWANNYRGVALARLGRVAEGLAELDHSFEEASAAGFDYIAYIALTNGISTRSDNYLVLEALERIPLLQRTDPIFAGIEEGRIRLALGELETALRTFEHTRKLSQQAESYRVAAISELSLAYLYSALGRGYDVSPLLVRDASLWNREDIGILASSRMRVCLSNGDVAAALLVAESVLEDFRRRFPSPPELYVLDDAMTVFVAKSRLAEASEIFKLAESASLRPDDPFFARMEGRLALAQDDFERARDHLQAAADFFARASLRNEEWPTRRLLAEAKARLGDRRGAEEELRQVLADAAEHGHVVEANAARKQLEALGIQVAVPLIPTTAPPPAATQVAERFVTVMFADVRGYTALSAAAAPADLADRTASFYRWSEQEVAHHHGHVVQYGGDAIMAIFNVSGLRLDHAVHALQAAMAIRDKAAFNELPVGIGIAVGPAVVGQLSQRSPVTAVGETINLAARLQTAAEAGEIVLDEQAFRRTCDLLDSEQQPSEPRSLSLKGFGAPVQAHLLPAAAVLEQRT